jgi:hypothetical protein
MLKERVVTDNRIMTPMVATVPRCSEVHGGEYLRSNTLRLSHWIAGTACLVLIFYIFVFYFHEFIKNNVWMRLVNWLNFEKIVDEIVFF